ncbi:hypothetical protein N0V95_002065 [Ascochyta clinopodiicola]|nr:hypothetical protein N0V95_002065 [Ascochyta clinopodiicola]
MRPGKLIDVDMHDIACQLVLKWARLGSKYAIPVTEDFTKLTLDTIALCAFDYRFNSFYKDEMHPYVQAMTNTLTAGMARQKIPVLMQKLMIFQNEKIRADVKFLDKISHELVRLRRENPSDKADLLNAMINGKDLRTGEGMRDELIAANMNTFLIAGHETTSGLLSFAFCNMLKNPATYFKAQEEVDRIIGKGQITVDHLQDLGYINAILRETLRLAPTAPAFSRCVREENTENPPTLGHGKYILQKQYSMFCLLSRIQRDPKVYGEDAHEFRPERMMDGKFEKLPKGAWKPFGTGLRACIGRAFAWQEALLVTAMLLQKFDFRLDDPSYELKIKSSLTIKPDGFRMRASLRKGLTACILHQSLTSSPGSIDPSTASHNAVTMSDSIQGKPLTVLYGSNAGTCQSLAQKLAADARLHGYHARVLDMDASVNALPTNQPVAIVAASYEGLPTDDAAQFVSWLDFMKQDNTLHGMYFAVFGCGHKDWASTFQRIPKLVDASLERLGGTRLAPLGSADASRGDVTSEFDAWCEAQFWPEVKNHFGKAEPVMGDKKRGIDMEISTKFRASQLQHDVQQGKTLKAEVLTASDEPEKRHLEIQLPPGMDYQAGDYLTILPLNPDGSVGRVLARFSLPADAVITIKEGGPATLPANRPVSVYDLLKGFVELLQPASKNNIKVCMEYTSDKRTLEVLASFASQEQTEVVTKRVSTLDLLEAYSAIDLPFPEYLAMLPPMRPRFYSISSSPFKEPNTCSITYGVINTASLSGAGQFQGVAGTYLRSLRPGDAIQVSVRSASATFHLPVSPHTIPIMMFCNGTGLAPFRGFIQERAIQLASNPHQELAPALLFIGCRSPYADSLYRTEFAEWEGAGAVEVRYAFSCEPSHPNAAGCKYVQDRVWKDRHDVTAMWKNGAKVFMCGSPGMVAGIKVTGRKIFEEAHTDATAEEIEGYFSSFRNERIVVEVFA